MRSDISPRASFVLLMWQNYFLYVDHCNESAIQNCRTEPSWWPGCQTAAETADEVGILTQSWKGFDYASQLPTNVHIIPMQEHCNDPVMASLIIPDFYLTNHRFVRGPFKRIVDRRQCAAVMQREAVTVTPSCRGGGNVVVAWSSTLQPSWEFEFRSS
jgi:hypothetical protein